MAKRKMARKKICIVTPEYPPEQWGGLARTVGNVSRAAAGMGLDVHVAHLNVEKTPLVLLDENRVSRRVNGITVHRLAVGTRGVADGQRELWDCPHTFTLRMMYQALEMLHNDEQFDLFHSFFLYPVGFITGMLSRRMNRSSMVTLVGNDIKKYVFSPEKVAVCRSGLENADRIVTLSRDLLDMADALTPVRNKARIIYNSVEIPSEAWQPRARKRGLFRIGCAGIFKYAKGLPYLFKAVSELGRSRYLKLDMHGTLRESEKEIYHMMLRRTGIKDMVRLGHPLAHDSVHRWLLSLDTFVLPSVSEGCPNILMEAMACGLPCVATRTGAVPELMDDRVSGLVVPWGDSRALAAALAELMDNPGLAASMGSAARMKMHKFSSQREQVAWEEVYRELMDF